MVKAREEFASLLHYFGGMFWIQCHVTSSNNICESIICLFLLFNIGTIYIYIDLLIVISNVSIDNIDIIHLEMY